MPSDADRTQQIIDTAIRLGAIGLIAYACFLIFAPFLLPVAWGIIIAVAVYPLHLRFVAVLGGRTRLALFFFTLVGLLLLITPIVLLAGSMVEAAEAAREAHEAGTLRVPPPPAGVAEWPIVGENLHELWTAASANLTETLIDHRSEIVSVVRSLLGTAAGTGATVLYFAFSVLIAAALMANAEAGGKLARAVARRLAGDAGDDFAKLATATTRSVAQGVLGVALIQSILSGMGMLAVGVPAAGVWSVLVLILAVVQLPPLVVLGPVIVYVFSEHETVPAVLFMIWAIAVSMSDTFLKPLLLGRGLEIPMLVILIGAIGGMLLAGVIGLFVGAVTLALAFKLFDAWLGQTDPAESSRTGEATP